MIAEVLYETRLDLLFYLEQYPHAYEDVRAEVLAVCAALEALQTQLDNPFSDDELAAMRAAQERRTGGDGATETAIPRAVEIL